ncbi:hypothetical protein QQ008_18360 [Fulvivirgaceae bacterium BMA10]|uniref:Uncharacterized protein n=1 Tax=Splendidivirga corallicola TaxID=3051826 RepID=A0ABT8KRH5_9BACT|nr:hypothetical protein [Fulvivirgaceae bacterium BMA10]
MKKIIVAISFTTLLFVAPNIYAQCDADVHAEACIPKLKEGFNFVKSYTIDGEGGSKSKVEYSYVFAKGTQYFINICSGVADATDGIVVSLYDSTRKLVSTSDANGKLYNAIAYPCNATGIYYIQFTFKGSQNHCGGAVLGFKR